jgi:hypothetical protein
MINKPSKAFSRKLNQPKEKQLFAFGQHKAIISRKKFQPILVQPRKASG